MTVLDAPPSDLAPRVASADYEDFAIPHGREEEWRFTPLDVVRPFFEPAAGAGVLTAETGPYVRVVDAADAPPVRWLPTDRPAAVAWAGASSAVVVDVPADAIVEEPIVVELSGTASVSNGRVQVTLGRHARATVVVVHDTSVDTAGVLVTDIGDGGDLTVLSVFGGEATGTHLWHWPAHVGRDAHVLAAQVVIGGRTVRVLPSVTYAGPGGSAELLGAFLAESGQHIEHRILVDHDQPHCSSRVVYKGALAGSSARTVWVGDVVVRRTAVGIDTYEMNRNLLLDRGARADSVPNLELETGDIVSAGHASATGTFDEEQLFYLQARGIPEQVARQLVVRGFFVDVLARIPEGHWRNHILDAIADRLHLPTEILPSEVAS